ncbi:MAG: heparan-alpha-glucosaminide N-acetyltransferase domain-containing protein [Bacillota bacterium]
MISMVAKTYYHKRIWELDFFRGLAIIMMVFDHLMFDFAFFDTFFSNFRQVDNSIINWLYEIANLYWDSLLRFIGREFFLLLFLIISGISFTFSKNNFIRGLKLLLVAILITVVTYLVENLLGVRVLIVFGVIHMFAFSILIAAIIRKFIKNEIIILFIGMLVLTFGFIFGMFSSSYVPLTWANLPKIIIGLNRYGADHFGIVPYVGFILIGTVIGNTFYKNRVSLLPQFNISKNNIFATAGRNTLLIYVLHQPLVLVFVTILAYILGYRF